ncbi:hydroxymethylglutaryl-CoA synthase [Leucobacter allii]|uniref:Hydroxymethylglutaryl-CoA synthase n=1 Tax=Leucobacter allii TaxID=2932247 RepID=A0ABY4FJB7_9MICO|nr:hydroxymethylglutaryl-CoA synthase [Leucobacter allii]UOQ56783.1 hydroxymethylglutaryl-CoA synthase [Leucobacter allii]UOR01216.1 hydroxymethylglutaryl-CoA synthase [Leucobacter allii]
MTAIGIHDLELASTHHVLDLGVLAEHTGVDPAKYRLGLGQDEFSVPAPDEDIVTMGASAALALLERTGTRGVRTLLFATESGIDHSKAAGVFVHQLLGLPPQVRVAEIKQACYGATAAIQAAVGIVQRHPDERVLVIASDVARYALDSPGEPTQGAGAAAILVSADPALVEIEAASGLFSENVDDFWRPNDSSTAIVDGKLSISAYLDAMTGAWDDLVAHGGPDIGAIDRLVYHQPYTKMAKKAQARLAEHTGAELGEAGLAEGAVYNRRIGNAYTASLYAGVASVLDHEPGLVGKRLGLFSYGSGSVSEFLTGVVRPGAAGRDDRFTAALDARVPLDVAAYRELHAQQLPSAVDVETPRVTEAPFRFAGIRGASRRYERR